MSRGRYIGALGVMFVAAWLLTGGVRTHGQGYYRAASSFPADIIVATNVSIGGVFRDTNTGNALSLAGAYGAIFRNNANTIGSVLKFDALPTIASGFGTSPSVTAGSTPLAGSVNVGTGGVAISGQITWNGTAFPSAPFCVVSNSLGSGVTVVNATTTTMNLDGSVAWTASNIIKWLCISSK